MSSAASVASTASQPVRIRHRHTKRVYSFCPCELIVCSSILAGQDCEDLYGFATGTLYTGDELVRSEHDFCPTCTKSFEEWNSVSADSDAKSDTETTSETSPLPTDTASDADFELINEHDIADRSPWELVERVANLFDDIESIDDESDDESQAATIERLNYYRPPFPAFDHTHPDRPELDWNDLHPAFREFAHTYLTDAMLENGYNLPPIGWFAEDKIELEPEEEEVVAEELADALSELLGDCETKEALISEVMKATPETQKRVSRFVETTLLEKTG